MTLEDARRRAAELSDLHAFISMTDETGDGTVVAVKDLIDVRGVPTTGGGIILPREPAEDDAEVVRNVRGAGGVVVGKTNLHEWAYGVTSRNPHYGDVLNPLDATRVAGGSSGGSAVAVATRMCDWAIGTDTGGSIRIPAALCGVVGFKPSLGSVSTDRTIPLSRTLDTVGPLARTVREAVAALAVLRGAGVPRAFEPLSRAPALAVPRGWVFGLDEPTAAAWNVVAAGLPEIDFPDRGELASFADTVLKWEAHDFHRRWLETSPGAYGEEVRQLLLRGVNVSDADYENALRDLLHARAAADAALDGYDALLLPSTAIVAPRVDERDVREPLTRFTRAFNATGQPVVVIRAPSPGLPVGIQVVGRFGDDERVAAVAARLEDDWASSQR